MDDWIISFLATHDTVPFARVFFGVCVLGMAYIFARFPFYPNHPVTWKGRTFACFVTSLGMAVIANNTMLWRFVGAFFCVLLAGAYLRGVILGVLYEPARTTRREDSPIQFWGLAVFYAVPVTLCVGYLLAEIFPMGGLSKIPAGMRLHLLSLLMRFVNLCAAHILTLSFGGLAVLVAGHTLYALLDGIIYTGGGRYNPVVTVYRQDAPAKFWWAFVWNVLASLFLVFVAYVAWQMEQKP